MYFKTRVVNIGNTPMGGDYPVRIQSMTSTDTMDTEATVDQTIKLIDAGCDYVRIAAPSVRAAKNLNSIKKQIRQRGYNTPLIADIHYNPEVAKIAAATVEKIRINPGNLFDKRGVTDFTGDKYKAELENIKQRILPLLDVCRKNRTVIRIGVNHGSLSERILQLFGNTIKGMVESALEYIRICLEDNFHDLVISLKSSDIKMMIDANRSLVERMQEEDMNYPLHLGVTEAGDAEDGRIKSAAGIGTLLKEGIGNTIRVSLTENPIRELPVAKKIINFSKPEKDDKVEYWKVKNYREYNTPFVISDNIDGKADLIVKEDVAFDTNGNKYILEKAEDYDPESILICKRSYAGIDKESFIVKAAMDFTSPLLKRNCQGIWITSSDKQIKERAIQTAFDILQVTGLRIYKTEYIACPSCGRTLFDISKELQKVKKATSHLKGLKIAVMGCIVNGPGEMAGADYGYVGSGKEKVTLYKGQEIKRKNVDIENAVDELLRLIKEYGDWVEKD